MAKKAAVPSKGRDPLDELIDGDGEWVDDLLGHKPGRQDAEVEGHPDLPRGDATRTLRQLEVALLPAVTIARDLFRAIAKGQAHPPVDPSIVSIFRDYRHYLHEWHVTLASDGEEPDELFAEYDGCIGHVLDCLGKMRRGEGITRLEALKADAWLRDVPGETILFSSIDFNL